jgi:UDP-N-acetylmuramoylalanine--D-glutamate ligase
MINTEIKGRKFVVVGANASAVALVKFLLVKGAEVRLVDTRAQEALTEALSEHLDLLKFQLEGGEFSQKTFEGAQTVILTPGVPVDSPTLEMARSQGVEVVSELDFVARYITSPIVAVAGTKGKTTTANLLANMLEAEGKRVFSNALQPLANYLISEQKFEFVVAVTNSFQLEGIRFFRPSTVCLLNLTEDHTNRYPNFESYLAANREVLKNTDADTKLIINAQDPHLMGIAPHLSGQTMVFSSQALPEGLEGAWYTKTHVCVRQQADLDPVMLSLENFRLRGAHNKENLCAAALAALNLGVNAASIQNVIDNVRALPHRVEFVRRINAVAFYNDACGANVNAAIRTLQAFNEPVILISGGRDKGLDYSPMISHIRQRVKNLILVGEVKEKINRAIGDYTETFLVGTLEEAIILAYQKSRSGDVVLFSPACDPTDVFASHEEKGEFFKRLVNQISQPRRPNVI